MNCQSDNNLQNLPFEFEMGRGGLNNTNHVTKNLNETEMIILLQYPLQYPFHLFDTLIKHEFET